GYKEMMVHGAIGYGIPLERFPDTYNGHPLCIVVIAAQKNYLTLHLMGVYGDPKRRKTLEDAYDSSGKRLDMGKGCLRFRSYEDLETNAIGEVLASTPPEKLIEWHEAARARKRR
ncbi:MAG: DUF1801 domain-containing protein, partial [Gemmatimonadota bacterium]